MESFGVQFLFVHLWQSKSCHGEEECHAHGNNFHGYRGQVQKQWYLKITKVHIYSNLFRFPISSLGLPNIPPQKS
jgi:hypothetical protein